MHEVLVNRLGGLSLPRKSVVRLTDHPDMTLDVYCGRITTTQHNNNENICCDPSLEPSRRDGSNDGSQYMFYWKNIDNYPKIIPVSLLMWSTDVFV